jgi:N-methylhydantoinase B/oxoprolinase/acetone carboxylase alpha subunit
LIYTPIFVDNRLIAYAGCAAHYVDVGGRCTDIHSRDNYEEGLRIPICKLYAKGERTEVVFDFIRENVRDPDTVLGDISAQVSANYIAMQRIQIIAKEFPDLDLTEVSDEIIKRSKKLTQELLNKFPQGEYNTSLIVPNLHGQRVEMCATVRIVNGVMSVDFSGSSPQSHLAINCTLAFTRSYAVFALYTLTKFQMPINEGVLDCLNVSAPLGCIFNAKFPAPVFGRSVVGNYIPELIYQALADVLPERIIAGSGSVPVWIHNFFYTREDGRSFATMNAVSGGLGARCDSDGISCVFFPANIKNLPVEFLESEVPILVEERAYLPDSFGHGKYRGGLGQRFSFRVDDEPESKFRNLGLVVRGARSTGAWGLAGGESPRLMPSASLNGETMPNVWTGGPLKPNDRVTFIVSGGGGLGNPRERDRAAVVEDIENEVISKEAAREAYGVES